jgi:hypothetical protein
MVGDLRRECKTHGMCGRPYKISASDHAARAHCSMVCSSRCPDAVSGLTFAHGLDRMRHDATALRRDALRPDASLVHAAVTQRPERPAAHGRASPDLSAACNAASMRLLVEETGLAACFGGSGVAD